MQAKSAIALFFAACVLLLSIGVARAGNGDDDISRSGVINFLNSYSQDLNALVEFGPGTSCNTSLIDTVRATAAGQALVQKYFSTDIQSYIVYKETAVTPLALFLNYSVVPGVSSTNGATILFPTTADLYAKMLSFYGTNIPASFSAPWYWLLSSPVVEITKRDRDFDRATTARITVIDTNQGFACVGSPPARIYRTSQNIYHHVAKWNDDLNRWEFVVFQETLKVRVDTSTSIITQVTPTPYP
jgi:hypothetical protein